MTKTQTDRKHIMTARLRQELALEEAARALNEFRDAAGWKQDRTPSQTETLPLHPAYHCLHGHGRVR